MRVRHRYTVPTPFSQTRRGTGPAPFPTRLARARLLFLRRRELIANWLALLVLLSIGIVGPADPMRAAGFAAPRDGARELRPGDQERPDMLTTAVANIAADAGLSARDARRAGSAERRGPRA